jgi:rhamnose utilization protein RhaD (predicted bifunctional aldolase and dehydrogenase)
MALNLPDDFDALRRCSAEMGSNRLLVQAAGGNTSIKQDGVMWIKASGKQLAHALDEDMFVSVDLAAMAKDITDHPQFADEPQRYALEKNGLRPSIETSLHAVFRHRVVLHAHCVNTIAFAVLQNAESALSGRLQKFKWAFVPYAKPGAHLARSVALVLQPETNVVVLGNHGLIVTGDNVAQAQDLLMRVHVALYVDLPSIPLANIIALKNVAGAHYDVLDALDPIHQCAFNAAHIKHALGGSLYPDHVTFCGVRAHALSEGQTADAYCQKIGAKPVLLIVAGAGVLIRKDYSAANLALARCMSDVMLRIPDNARLSYLTLEQNEELNSWEAETYRQKLNA